MSFSKVVICAMPLFSISRTSSGQMLSWYCLYSSNDPGFNRMVKARRTTRKLLSGAFFFLAGFTSILSAGFSTEHFALILGWVEKIDLVHGLEMCVVGKFPDDLFVSCYFKGLRLFTHEAAGEIVANVSVPIAQTLAASGQPQRVSGHVVLPELPDHFQIFIQFDDLHGLAEGDEQMAVRQFDGRVWESIHRDLTEQRPVG